MRLELTINSEAYIVDVDPATRLVSVLRDTLGLVGTKLACGEGACGACAVLVDDEPVASCLYLAAQAQGRRVETIEGISRDGLTPLQDAFVRNDATQCGFCTPGQVVSATALLRADPAPTPDAVRDALAGNLCRCGCYVNIERAVLDAAGGAA